MERVAQKHAIWMSVVAARQGNNSLSLDAAGPAGAAAAPTEAPPTAPPPGLLPEALPAVVDDHWLVDVEQLKHDFALHTELVAELSQRVQTLEALRRQEPARGGPIRHRSWWDNDEGN